MQGKLDINPHIEYYKHFTIFLNEEELRQSQSKFSTLEGKIICGSDLCHISIEDYEESKISERQKIKKLREKWSDKEPLCAISEYLGYKIYIFKEGYVKLKNYSSISAKDDFGLSCYIKIER